MEFRFNFDPNVQNAQNMAARYSIREVESSALYVEAKDEEGNTVCERGGFMSCQEKPLDDIYIGSRGLLRNDILDYLFKTNHHVKDAEFKEVDNSIYLCDKKSGLPLFAAQPVPLF